MELHRGLFVPYSRYCTRLECLQDTKPLLDVEPRLGRWRTPKRQEFCRPTCSQAISASAGVGLIDIRDDLLGGKLSRLCRSAIGCLSYRGVGCYGSYYCCCVNPINISCWISHTNIPQRSSQSIADNGCYIKVRRGQAPYLCCP